ncbi:mRNA decay activator protein ZFP36L1 isoform X2 [Thalassophryne amazonica]|uniref:mRNA decay activator protein ZFP36L1 isoform X2 n=1 Tax=Thalassophryne amazonica TaxID=390379 RepID=UPI001470F243|nr:mRNA decay activator protein ZFP36L1 isoform X2 [Thalassophryne amazonica]
MPSYPLNQCADLENMMCKLLRLGVREQNGPSSFLTVPTRTPGCIGQPRSYTSFSLSLLPYITSDPSDVCLSSCHWGQQFESSLDPASTQCENSGFLAQRSSSLVENSSAAASGLCWSGTDWFSNSDITQSALNFSSTLASLSSSSTSSRYKTELCRSFTESGLCKYGAKCQFAHGPQELRDLTRHPKYKTEPCRTFHTIGYCPYGIRCHFVHNSEEENKLLRSHSSSSSGLSTRSHKPLVRQSFSFPGFPSTFQQSLQPAIPTNPMLTNDPFAGTSSASPLSCADVTDLLSHAFLEMDSAFEASPATQYPNPTGWATAADPHPQFLPSPDSGCSPSGPSPTASPSLRQSPCVSGAVVGPPNTLSLSFTSLSEPDWEGSSGSSTSSLNGSECCSVNEAGGINESNGKRLAVFSQLSVPEDASAFCSYGSKSSVQKLMDAVHP